MQGRRCPVPLESESSAGLAVVGLGEELSYDRQRHGWSACRGILTAQRRPAAGAWPSVVARDNQELAARGPHGRAEEHKRGCVSSPSLLQERAILLEMGVVAGRRRPPVPSLEDIELEKPRGRSASPRKKIADLVYHLAGCRGWRPQRHAQDREPVPLPHLTPPTTANGDGAVGDAAGGHASVDSLSRAARAATASRPGGAGASSRGRRSGDGRGREQDQAAAKAQQAGERFSASVVAQSERESRTTSGSDMATGLANVEPPSVSWSSPSSAGQPPAVSQPTSSPNVDRPIDNSQSQP